MTVISCLLIFINPDHLDQDVHSGRQLNDFMEDVEPEPAIDRSPRLSEADLSLKLQDKMPNLPLVYWQEHKNKNMRLNSTCAKFPDIFDLHFNNRYWQETETSDGTFILYAAYLDDRPSSGPLIRVLGMINRIEPQVKGLYLITQPFEGG